MASSWKHNPSAATSTTRKVALRLAREILAVEPLGSTAGQIVQMEGQFVERFHAHPQDQACRWDSSCSKPVDVSSAACYWNPDQGETYPEEVILWIFAKNSILQSEVWFLMTDGEVLERHVQEFASAASRESVTDVPVYLKIPDSMNISVASSVYATATQALLLFKDTHSGKLCVVAAKGAFSPLAKFADHIDLSKWEDLGSFDNENALIEECERLRTELTDSADRHDTPAVSLGQAWDSSTGVLVNIDSLLCQIAVGPVDMDHILQDEAFGQLALVSKTRRRLTDLRSSLTRHEQEVVLVQVKDTHGVEQILQKLRGGDQSEKEIEQLSAQLRQAYLGNREAYLKERHSPSEVVRATKRLNRALDQMVALLADLEKTGYMAEILSRKTHRARPAEDVHASSSDVHLSGIDLSGSVQAFRGTCNICCGEDEIMSVVLKKLVSAEENTSDFFLNFPLVVAQAQQNADVFRASAYASNVLHLSTGSNTCLCMRMDQVKRALVHAFMHLIYCECIATNVPRALCDQSAITSTSFWHKLEDILGDREDGKQFLDSISNACRPAACRRVQIIIFWAIFTQNEHMTAKGFFHKLRLQEAMAPPFLNFTEQLPDESMLQKILRSIFLEDRKPTDIAHDDSALLRSERAPYPHPDLIRKRRAKHFNQVFQHGTGTETGLPEPVNAPERPSSEHDTLHMSIVKVWSALPLSLKTIRTAGPDEIECQTVTSELNVINRNEQTTGDFFVRAREHICSESHRGNIDYHGLDDEIREPLPSFFEAPRVASKSDGLDDKSGLSYVHDWTKKGDAMSIPAHIPKS
ncbi:MAG: hypothetical protein Q9173_001699 [Seirophora scorigena]